MTVTKKKSRSQNKITFTKKNDGHKKKLRSQRKNTFTEKNDVHKNTHQHSIHYGHKRPQITAISKETIGNSTFFFFLNFW